MRGGRGTGGEGGGVKLYRGLGVMFILLLNIKFKKCNPPKSAFVVEVVETPNYHFRPPKSF